MKKFFAIGLIMVGMSMWASPVFSQQAPTLKIDFPTKGYETVSSNVVIEGTFIPGTTKDRVLINDSAVILPRAFKISRPLFNFGKNTFNFKVFSNTILVQDFNIDVKRLDIKPTIKLDEPKADTSRTSSVLFRGSAANTSALTLNGEPIDVGAKGEFAYAAFLSTPNAYNRFTLKAVSPGGLVQTLEKNVYYNQVKPTVKPVLKEETASDKIPVIAVAPVSPKAAVHSDDGTSITDDASLPTDLQEALSKRITLELSGADVKEVFRILSKKSGLNIVSDNNLNGSVNIYLKDSTIKNAIQFILDTQGLTYRVVDNTIVVASPQRLEAPTRLITKVIKLNNIKAKDAEAVLQQHLSKGESVQGVVQDNLLVISADAGKFNQLAGIAKRIDFQKVPQVFLEVQIIESSTTALEQKGVAWPSTLALGVEANITNEKTIIQSNPSFRAVVRMLEEEGKAKILASPSLKTLNEEEAEIFIGDKIPVVQNIVDTTGRISESVIFVDSGITLRVLPSINPQTKEIRLKIRPEVSVINGYKGPNNDKPIIKTRKVNTVVSVKDTETVVIGGLFNSNETDTKDQVPMLGNIPLLGNLFFSAGSREKSQTELIISVTPRIVESDDTSARVGVQKK
jgi:type II secretory pathway component GspD/PulD (secretin)